MNKNTLLPSINEMFLKVKVNLFESSSILAFIHIIIDNLTHNIHYLLVKRIITFKNISI